MVFASLLFPHPLSLDTMPEIVAVVMAAFVGAQISGGGENNGPEGARLLALYVLPAVLFYFLPAEA